MENSTIPKLLKSVEIKRIRVRINRAKLVKRLFELREEAIAKGMPLLNEDKILAEIKTRRGEEA